ncbi:MAG: histidine phosphatase family protein, partial [Acidimicrobiales bacterium]
MARILIVRHGQSEWNAMGRWQGQADISLTDLGRAQARAAATRLGSFDLIAASTLMRAAETAYIISNELGIGPISPMVDLVERSVGEWSGLTSVEIEEGWPDHLRSGMRPASWETDAAMWARVER